MLKIEKVHRTRTFRALQGLLRRPAPKVQAPAPTRHSPAPYTHVGERGPRADVFAFFHYTFYGHLFVIDFALYHSDSPVAVSRPRPHQTLSIVYIPLLEPTVSCLCVRALCASRRPICFWT